MLEFLLSVRRGTTTAMPNYGTIVGVRLNQTTGYYLQCKKVTNGTWRDVTERNVGVT